MNSNVVMEIINLSNWKTLRYNNLVEISNFDIKKEKIMDVRLLDTTPPEAFGPFEIGITFNTIDEVREMWHRLNISMADVKKHSSESHCLYPTESSIYALWVFLDNYLHPNK